MTELPADVVERAARALAADAADDRITGEGFHLAAHWLRTSRLALAAALDGCEVREEWVLLVDGPPTVGTGVMDASESRTYIEEQIRDAGQYPRRFGRRLVITTNPVEVDPGGAKT